MNPCEVTVHVQEKKKKKVKTWNWKRAAGFSWIQMVTMCFLKKKKKIRVLEGVWSYGSKHTVQSLNTEH